MAQARERVDGVQLDAGAGIAEQALEKRRAGLHRRQPGERAGCVGAHVLVRVEQGLDERPDSLGMVDAAERQGGLAAVNVDPLAQDAAKRPAHLAFLLDRASGRPRRRESHVIAWKRNAP